MNTLLEGSPQMPYYTDLSLVFRALGGAQRHFHWILTDLDCIAFDGEPLPPRLRGVTDIPVVYSGDALSDFVTERRIQFVWAVLSGFPPDELPDVESLDPYPFADGNRALWLPGASIQHPGAEVEIVCYDSSATLLLTRSAALTRQFRTYFPDAVDLDEHIAQQARTDR